MTQLVRRFTGTFHFTSACLFPLLISAGAIVFFILFLLLPAFSQNAALLREIQEHENAIERQEMLAPAYAMLTTQLRDVSSQYLHEEQRIFSAPTSPEMAAPALGELVDASGLTALSIIPNPSSLSLQNGLSVVLRLTGDFRRLRDLLMRMTAQPWMLSLESLEVIGGGDQEEMRIRVNVRLDAEEQS
jgi:hypothetical protein